MSHFTIERFNLKADRENISKVRIILEDLSLKNNLNMISDKEITNRYGIKVRVLLGLESPKINPLGLKVEGGDLVIAVDYDFDHFDSKTKEETYNIYQQLQQRIIQLKKDTALSHTQREVDRLQGTNVTIKIH
jgi:hypothetical protein